MMMLLLLFSVFIFINGFMFAGQMGMLLLFFMFLLGFYLIGVEGFKGDIFMFWGHDNYSFFLVMLTIWVLSIVMIFIKDDMGVIYFMVSILMLFLVLMFSSLNLMYFFFFFELSIIPMFIIILYKGYGKDRYMAGAYMFIYTLISSLPSLFLFMYLYNLVFNMSIDYLSYNFMDLDMWVKCVILVMFMVKIPMFFFHIWLPKAHVEAPVYGSMILASVMLKMGGYGLLRFGDIFLIDVQISDFFMVICLSGSLIIGVNCLYQVDMKVMVAYSSIIHMGMMIAGLLSGLEMGIVGSLIAMISHGVCSSCLFYMVNLMYIRTGSRLIYCNLGILSSLPVFTYFWLLILVNNLGVPPCFSIVSEIYLMTSMLSYSYLFMVMGLLLVFMISCFIMNMFINKAKGVLWVNYFMLVSEYLIMVCHMIPLNFCLLFLINLF